MAKVKTFYAIFVYDDELGSDINIEELENADPRLYCAVVASDGKAYAISVYDW